MDNNELIVIDDNNLRDIIPFDNLPDDLKRNFGQIAQIMKEEKMLPDLYPKILSEVSVSTSIFQDRCVQYETCYTPHRKLRQAMLEMDNRMRALYTAKTGHKKAQIKIEELKLDIEDLEREIEDGSEPTVSYRRLELKKRKKEALLEEAERDMGSAIHMVKDAMLKVSQQQELIKEFEEEAEASGLSFDEAEVYHFVMYFTKDAECQLRTGGRVDTGTFGAIGQLPEPIRKKVLWNIDFLKQKIFNENWNGDYLYIVYRDILEPKRTGDGEYEGMNVKEFLKVTPIQVLSPNNQLTHEGESDVGRIEGTP